MTARSPRIAAALLAAMAASAAPHAAGAEPGGPDRPWAPENAPHVYVPVADLPGILAGDDRAVLMDRRAFAKLLADARAADARDGRRDVARIVRADYTGTVAAEAMRLTATLRIVSLSDRPVAVPLRFAGVGLTEMALDGEPAPLGHDRQGRLVLVVTGRGEHVLTLAGSTAVRELDGGGVRMGMTIPPAAAGEMRFSAAGDLEVHATVPVAEAAYDRAADRTACRLTVGGRRAVTVVLMGNGTREDRRAILLGSSATTVQFTRASQTLHSVYTVQVLRRGVRELTFELPADWAVTDVTCPSLVTWSVGEPAKPGGAKRLVVRLRTASRGTKALVIQAAAGRGAAAEWTSPALRLVGADFQHGHLLVDPGSELKVRGQALTSARQEDPARARSVAGLLTAAGGRLYYHWADDWAVKLDLATVAGRRVSRGSQRVEITRRELSLSGEFEITAVGRDCFALDFELPAEPWQLREVTVGGKDKGFEYRVVDDEGRRVLKIALAAPVRPEGVAKVRIALRRVPADWAWPAGAGPREIELPAIVARAETVSGHLAVAPGSDLDVAAVAAPDGLTEITVGRMAAAGLRPDVQLAWRYEAPPAGTVGVRVSRTPHRLAADAVALVTVRGTHLAAAWRITWRISRAHARTLYLLADKALGRAITIAAPGRHIAARAIVEPGPGTVELPEALAEKYNLWQVSLDSPAIGEVVVEARYDRPLADGDVPVPLVRPLAGGQTRELLAVQAGEELAVTVDASGARDVDAVDLPPLPGKPRRLLRAFRLTAPDTPGGEKAAVRLATKLHEPYAIPAALAAEVRFTTQLGAGGEQETEAVFRVANAGLQFLPVRLPRGAKLLSARVAGKPVRPKRDAAGDLLLGLPRSAEPIEVRVVFACAENGGPGGRIHGAELPGVQINTTTWRVLPPPGYRITTQYTDMQADRPLRPRLAGQGVIDGLREVFGGMAAIGAVGSARLAQDTVSRLEDYDEKVAHRRSPSVSSGGEAHEAEESLDEERPADTPPPATRREPDPQRTPEATPPDRPTEDDGVQLTPDAGSYKARKRGRYTLPVELLANPYAGPKVEFSAIGAAELGVGLTYHTTLEAAAWLGAAATLLIGLLLARRPVGARVLFAAAVLAGATLVAIWWPGAAYFANGAFYGALLLIPVWLVLGFIRWVWVHTLGRVPSAPPAATAAMLALCLLPAAAEAGKAAKKAPPKPVAAPARPEPLVFPYTGDPAEAEKADKVLIPYRRYVELWNRAHPDERIELPAGPVNVALAGARYEARLAGDRMEIALTARVRTFGRGAVTLPLPMQGLAATSASFDGEPAKVYAGRKGLTLTLPADRSGELAVRAVTTPAAQGRRGSVALTLPPLPGAVFVLDLPEADLELEAPGLDGAPARAELPGGRGVRWTVPVGSARKLALRWSPKVGAGAADRTLSASVEHDVYAFQWALVGVSRLRYAFSAGRRDRFGLLLPAGATLAELTGANLRDFRIAGDKQVDGEAMKVVEVRLHRPAERQYEVTARWVRPLPALGKPADLALPRAAEVGRESGAVDLHAAAGMELKVQGVRGGRRTASGSPRGKGKRSAEAPAPPGGARRIGRYYWPYRPFGLTFRLARADAVAEVRLDQLVRIDRRQVQLLADVHLTAAEGLLFGSSFALPDGYELLSVVGAAVEDHYEQPADGGRRLHVTFRGGVESAKLAVVLVRRDARLADLPLPALTALDADGRPVADQAGRLAVQVAASLEAATLAGENLRSVAPRELSGCLDAPQLAAVQFAYRYEEPPFSLRLAVRPQKTKVRVQVFGGLTVRATSAWYAYRLRYTIEGTPIDRVRFTLPSRYAPLVAVRSPAMRSVSHTPAPGGGDRTEWTVSLVHEVTGVLDVAVNFALPIDPTTTALAVPRIATEAREGYRAILAVQNASRHELSLLDRRGLSDVPASEQAQVLPDTVRRNLQFVLQSFTGEWSVVLGVKPAKAARRVDAIVDLLALTTVLDARGQARYRAKLTLQNRTRQFLRVRVPDGLKLWSATVAGQAVKPVTDPAAGAGLVLVPLVKTSPGGLPYEVSLYLAGAASEPLGLISRLEPPAIGIEGMPVERTTWSLRLPKGYRYFRPGGNVSPVVSELEARVIAARARMSQLKRQLSSFDVLLSSGSNKGKYVAKKNWAAFNKKVANEIDRTRQAIESNRRELSTRDYQRLSRSLEEQQEYQYGLQKVWARNVSAVDEAQRGNVNVFLNNDVGNGGVAEIVRNSAINGLPAFVRSAAARQREQITLEMKAGEKQAAGKEIQLGVGTQLLVANGDRAETTMLESIEVDSGTRSGSLTLGGQQVLLEGGQADRQAQVRGLLNQLESKQRANLTKRQDELKDQLASLADNRLVRYYDKLNVSQGERAQQPQQQAEAQTLPGPGQATFALRAPARGEQQAGGDDRNGRQADLSDMSVNGAVPGGPQSGEHAADAGGADHFDGAWSFESAAGAPRTARRDGGRNALAALPGLAVARGTFSLPVELPEGGVRRDFQGPTGRPVVSLLAVDERLIEGAHRTAAVLVVTIVFALAWMLVRLARGREAGPACGFAGAYGLLGLVVAGTVLAGGVDLLGGILLFGAIAVPAELLRRLAARRTAAAA